MKDDIVKLMGTGLNQKEVAAKLGIHPSTVSRQLKMEEPAKVDLKKEIGSVGKSHSDMFDALGDAEYLGEVRWPASITIYDKMRRSDAQAKAMLLVMELPLRSTKWYIKPYSEDAKDTEIAETIEENLFSGPPIGMTIHWDDFLRLALTMLAFGHSVFEKVYELKNGYLRWRKFAQRPQRTIHDFNYDEHGGPAAVKQLKVSKTSYEYVDIPIEKLLVFSYQMEGGDLRGQSVLRAAYKHWKIKDFLYKISNIGIERNYVGTPTMELPESYTQADYDQAKRLVEDLRSADKGGALIPKGFVLDMFEGKRGLADALPYIEHHDVMMVRSILAQFINLGSKEVGSYALSSDQSDMFLMCLNATAEYIKNTINSYAIPQLVDYNWDVQGYPTLQFEPIGKESEKLIKILSELSNGRLIVPDENIEEWLRNMLDLPEKGEPTGTSEPAVLSESEKANQAKNSANYFVRANNIPGRKCMICKKEPGTRKHHPDYNQPLKVVFLCEPCHQRVEAKQAKCPAAIDLTKLHESGGRNFNEAGERRWRRDLTAWEKNVNLEELERKWDSEEEKLIKQGKELTDKQIDQLFERMQKEVEAGNYDELAKIPVAYRPGFSKLIGTQYKDLIEYGKEQGAEELNIDVETVPTSQEDRKMANARAAAVSDQVSQQIKTRAVLTCLGAIEEGRSVKDALYRAKEAAKETAERELKATASAQVGNAINDGRQAAADKAGVKLAQYSAILDDVTCPLCRWMDGSVIETANPDYNIFSPQVHRFCRCVWVYIRPEETPQPDPTWETPPGDLVERHGHMIYHEC